MREQRRAPRPTRNARRPRPPRPRRPESARPRPSRRRPASGSVSRGRSRRERESQAAPPRAPAARPGSTHHLGRACARHSQLGHRRCVLGIREVRGPDEAHPLERQLVVGRAGHRELVDLARPRAHGLRRPAEELFVELRPASVADRAERVDGEHAEEPLRHRLGNVKGEVPAPGMADHVCPLPPERVEHTPGIPDIRRHRVGRCRRRRLLPSLLVPRDVVLLRELVGEIAQVVKAEPRPAVQQEDRWPTAGAATRNQRPVVVRGELGPRHRPRSSHALPTTTLGSSTP